MAQVLELINTQTQELKDITNDSPFEKGPCILMIPPKTTTLDLLDENLKTVAKLLYPDDEFLYDPDRRILGLGYGGYDSEYDQIPGISQLDFELAMFVNLCFRPLFIENGKRVDVETAMKRIRNITFLAYCGGTKRFLEIEEKLKHLLNAMGYKEKEILLILSQVCVAAISGYFLMTDKTSALAITFGDIKDDLFLDDIKGESFKDIKKTRKDIKNMKSGYIRYGFSLGYATDYGYEKSDEMHSFSAHLLDNSILSAKIKTFLETSLANAQENIDSDTLIPMTYKKMDKALANSSEQPKHRL